MAGQLRLTGGGRFVAVACRSGEGALLLPCGRCRQVLYEFGGPSCLVDTARGPGPAGRAPPGGVRPVRPALIAPARLASRRELSTRGDQRRRRDRRQARRRPADRRADRLGDRRLHPRRGRRRADVGAGHGDPAERDGRGRDQPLDPGDDRLRRACSRSATSGVRWSTSTPPAGSATRSPCRSPRSSPRAGRRCRSCPGAGSGTPAARWTSWSRSPAGAPRSPSTRSRRSWPTSAP